MKIAFEKGISLVEIFVDDIIFGGKDVLCKSFVDQMREEFEMSMFGETNYFCWLASVLNEERYLHYTIKIYQGDTIFFGMEDSRLVWTTIATIQKLSKNDDSTKVKQMLYRSIVGKLQ